MACPRPGWGSFTREITGLVGVGRPDAMAATCRSTVGPSGMFIFPKAIPRVGL